jgi:hypothetical protein
MIFPAECKIMTWPAYGKIFRAVQIAIVAELSKAVTLRFRNVIKCTHACALYAKALFFYYYILCTVHCNVIIQYTPTKYTFSKLTLYRLSADCCI